MFKKSLIAAILSIFAATVWADETSLKKAVEADRKSVV